MQYKDLSEAEKIPLRIQSAEALALQYLSIGYDLQPILKRCIDNGYYCGAEGIKRAMAKFNPKAYLQN